MTSRSILFGWGVPKFAQQLPSLSVEDAAAADADNTAIIRLSVRGLLTEAERDRVIRRATRHIQSCLTKIPAPGIEVGTATTEGRGAEHEGEKVPEGWQPIETAPQDGTLFWALEGTRGPSRAQYICWRHTDDRSGTEYWQDEADSEPQPTHWRPLPAAPRPSSQGGQGNA